MAADGDIDQREIFIIGSIFEKLHTLNYEFYNSEINSMILQLNSKGRSFINDYFNELEISNLSVELQLKILNIAVQVINADEKIEYSEIKFIKNIRYRLNLSDEIILKNFPEFEQYLEQDINISNQLEKLTSQFFESTNLPIINQGIFNGIL